jgi:hypothetical protein
MARTKSTIPFTNSKEDASARIASRGMPSAREKIPARIASIARSVTPVGRGFRCTGRYRFAPQLGQRVAPAGMLAPQFLQVMPIEPMGAEPIGIEELIIGGGIAPGAIVGLKVSASMPPISPRRKPMKNPPIAVTQLIIESISTMTPHILALVGLECIMNAPTTMMSPMITPTIPSASTVLLAEAAPVMFNEPIIDPAKARRAPPKITNIPPISERTIAAVGLSPILSQIPPHFHNI